MGEAKTYVFGNEGNSLASMIPALCNGGNNAALTAAMMNNGGFGGNNGWWIILLLIALRGYGFNGENGNAAGTERILLTLNGDTGREMILSSINGNTTALSQLQSTLNCDVNTLQMAICDIRSSIQQVGSQVGLSSQLIINAAERGDANIISQLQTCCCNVRESITLQGYENRINNTQNTALLAGKIDNQTTLINDKFCLLEMREMLNKIDSLREMNSTLRGQLSNEHQTATIQAANMLALAPISAAVSSLSSEVAAIKCKLPETVTLPANQGRYITPCQETLLGLGYGNGFYGFPYAYNGGSIWS